MLPIKILSWLLQSRALAWGLKVLRWFHCVGMIETHWSRFWRPQGSHKFFLATAPFLPCTHLHSLQNFLGGWREWRRYCRSFGPIRSELSTLWGPQSSGWCCCVGAVCRRPDVRPWLAVWIRFSLGIWLVILHTTLKWIFSVFSY
jgi:hypothetical protein